MTAQMSLRKKTSAWLATTTAALLALSGLAAVPAVANAADQSYGVSVTAINGAEPVEAWPNAAINAGTTLTLSGRLPEKVHTDGNGRDVAAGDLETGIYLQWCVKPAVGQRPASGTCDGKAQQWLTSVALGSPYNLPASGEATGGVWNFTAQMTPPKSIGDVACGADGAGECGVFVRLDHRFVGADARSFDQFIPITFASHYDGAVLAVSNPSVTEGKLTFDTAVTNTHFEADGAKTDSGKADAGAYVSLIEAGTYSQLTQQNMGIAVGYAYAKPTASSVATPLSVQLSALDPSKQYEVVSWRAHGNPSAERFLASVPFAFAPSFTLKATASTVKYNAAESVNALVSSPIGTPSGKAIVKIAGQSYPVDLIDGSAMVKLVKPLDVGSYAVTAEYVSGSNLFLGTSASATLKVSKATPKVSARLAKKSVSAKRNGKLNVAVSIPGSLGAKAAKYKVQVFDGKKKLKTVTLSSSGKASVKLPKLKRGTHKLKVVVRATANTNAKSSSVVKLKVTR